MTFWILSAILTKREGDKATVSNLFGYRIRETEDEARGSFLTALMEKHPGNVIDRLAVLEVPPEHFPSNERAGA